MNQEYSSSGGSAGYNFNQHIDVKALSDHVFFFGIVATCRASRDADCADFQLNVARGTLSFQGEKVFL